MSILDIIKKENMLSGVALDVYAILDSQPNMTVGEIYRKYKGKYPKTTRNRAELSKRVSDLCNWGAVEGSGSTKCSYSSREATLWRITGRLPNRTTNRKTEKGDQRKAEPLLSADLAAALALCKTGCRDYISDLSITIDKLTRKRNGFVVRYFHSKCYKNFLDEQIVRTLTLIEIISVISSEKNK